MISDAVGELAELLLKKRYTISIAESCTGGMISSSITNIPGASEFFLGCAVTYSNGSKEKLLNVPRKILERFGAVSAETAEKMAEGAKALFESDIAAAVTGIAGPGGGTPLKPVGTVYIAVAYGNITICERLDLSGSRNDIREAVAERTVRQIIAMIGIQGPTVCAH